MKIEPRYLNGAYLASNPDWDRGDAGWKANHIARILGDHNIVPGTICEVGCGSGDILRFLKQYFPGSQLFGYDVSPQAQPFWEESAHSETGSVKFTLGDFHQVNRTRYDVLVMADVFEHVRDPFTFLESSRSHANCFVFHIPLDLSALGVIRKRTLLDTRKQVGHLHFYTKDLALETLTDCGYRIIEWRYTRASINKPHARLKTQLAGMLRRLVCLVNRDWGIRLLGGETLIVLAEQCASSADPAKASSN